MGRLNTITIAYGHGLSVTPLQLAASTLPLVNGGFAVTPTFLPRTRIAGLRQSPSVLKPATSHAMLSLMRLNVLKGTGKRAEAEGYRVGGKTGTAEKVVGRELCKAPRFSPRSCRCSPPTLRNMWCSSCSTSRTACRKATIEQTPGANAAPTVGRIVARIAPILGVAPRLPDDQRKFDAKVLASY